MIFITHDEQLQLEEFLIERQWVPGNSPGTWVQMRWDASLEMDGPYFLLVTEVRSDEVTEVAGLGIREEWSEEEIKTHILDILRAGTVYGIRCNLETYLSNLGIEAPQAHALQIIRVIEGDVPIPIAPEPLRRVVYFENHQGWVQFTWKGGHTIHTTVAIHCEDVDGYGTYTGYLHSSHGAEAVRKQSDGDHFPYGLFSDRRKRERPTDGVGEANADGGTHPGNGAPSGEGNVGGGSPQPKQGERVPELSPEVLLEVRGEPGGGVSNS